MIDENEYESSFEKMDGEEEDEDDLLKSESETNKSSNKEQPIKQRKMKKIKEFIKKRMT